MTEDESIRLLIVEDHELLLLSLKALVETEDTLMLVGTATTGEEAVRLAHEHLPDVILMDLQLPGMNGIEATHAIRECCPHIKIVVLTSFYDTELVQAALRAGAITYLNKNISNQELVAAIHAAYRGQSTLSPQATQAIIQFTQTFSPKDYDLTHRETQVLECMTRGLTNTGIAKELFISISTAKKHVHNVLTKLGVTNRTEAVRMAIEDKLLQPRISSASEISNEHF